MERAAGTPAAPQAQPDLDVEALGDLALALAVEAGALVVDERPAEVGVAATKSSATDVVTVMDQRSQDLLVARLGELRPEDGVHGEEADGTRPGTSGVTWVLDPIDGTVNYLYGLPAYAVSVAAVVGDPTSHGAWRPVAGAVVNPVTGERYRAVQGQGATLAVGDGPARPLRVADEGGDLSQALCGTGFGYAASRRRWQGRVLAELLPEVRDIRRLGSAALDLCRVADGTLDVYFERGLSPWDLAAGWLVAAEAGATVTDLAGGDPGTPFVVAGPPGLHARLRDHLVAAVAEVGEEEPLGA